MSDYLEPNIDKFDAINIIKNSIENDKSFLFPSHDPRFFFNSI